MLKMAEAHDMMRDIPKRIAYRAGKPWAFKSSPSSCLLIPPFSLMILLILTMIAI